MLSKLLRRSAVLFFYGPPEVFRFFARAVGREYGVGVLQKAGLVLKILRNSTRAGAASSFLEQLALARAILSVPASCQGDVAEFGCFKGLSTATLSIVCQRTGRRLLVFESFEGLPDPEADITNISDGTVVAYNKGDYAGSLDEVKQNVSRYGRIDACEFVRGFFDQTLPSRPESERYCLIFEDADLPSSVRTVIQWGWPRLHDGGVFFTHEARDLEVVKIFFDDPFWERQAGVPAPGMIGSGLGMPYSVIGSCLGYVTKRPRISAAAPSP